MPVADKKGKIKMPKLQLREQEKQPIAPAAMVGGKASSVIIPPSSSFIMGG